MCKCARVQEGECAHAKARAPHLCSWSLGSMPDSSNAIAAAAHSGLMAAAAGASASALSVSSDATRPHLWCDFGQPSSMCTVCSVLRRFCTQTWHASKDGCPGNTQPRLALVLASHTLQSPSMHLSTFRHAHKHLHGHMSRLTGRHIHKHMHRRTLGHMHLHLAEQK